MNIDLMKKEIENLKRSLHLEIKKAGQEDYSLSKSIDIRDDIILLEKKIKEEEFNIVIKKFSGLKKLHHYCKYGVTIEISDGVKYVADTANAYWLLDLILSFQRKIRFEEVQVWALVRKGEGVVVSYIDVEGDPKEQKEIAVSDFPADIQIWLVSGTAILPNES